MTPRLALLAALGAAALAAAAPARAAAPWDGAPFSSDPGELALAAAALPPRGGPIDVLVEEGTFRLDASGAVTFTHRLVARPLTAEAARAYGRVERGFAPWHQARPELRARVVGPEGGAAELDPALLAEGPGPGERRVLSAPLPNVRAGSIVEEVTVLRDTSPAFDAGVVHRFWFAQGAPPRLVRLVVIAPDAVPVRFAVRGLALEPVERRAGGQRTWTFERRDGAFAVPPEPSATRDAAAAPHVAFSSGRSWREVAARYAALCEERLRGEDLAEAAREALGAAPPGGGRAGREEALRRVAAWLRDRVRATGGMGDGPAGPARPSETLARRAGDAEDLALLAAALLRAAGHDAHVALLSSGWQEVPPELPGLGLLDHAVVRVAGSPALWLDPSDRFTAPGALPPALQGRLALVAAPGTKGLEATPEAAAADATARTTREVFLADLGPGRVVETRELTGALAAAERAFRARLAAAGATDVEARYAREVLAGTLTAFDVAGLDDPAVPLRVRVEAEGSAAAETRDAEAGVPVPPDAVFAALPAFLTGAGEPAGAAAPPPRRADVLLPVPFRAELAYRIVPADGFRARPLPADAREPFGRAVLERRFRLEPDGSVVARYTFDTGGRRLAADDATALSRRVRALSREGAPRIEFERTAAALLAAGKVPEALAELRRLSAARPRSATHRLHHAVALLQLGFQEAAAAEARAGIALEPGRAWGHRVLGFVLEHDVVGRVRGPGFDRAGALAAYRRGAELDPRHAGGRAALADLLATSPSGVRLGPGADLPAAIAALQAVRDDLGERSFDASLLAALLAAGRDAEAAQLARDAEPGPQRNALLVAAVAAAEGPEAGLAAAPAGEARRPALREAAQLLLRRRLYPAAAALAAEAARGAPNAAEARAQAEAFARLRPWKAQLGEGDEPARLVKRLLAAAVVEADPARAAAPLVAARAVELAGRDDALAGLPLSPEQARRASEELGAGPDVFLDLILSRLELLADGDPGQALRVRLRFPDAAAARGSTVFLVRERGGLRLLATDLGFPLLGGEALRLADAGDLAGARRWLAWAREALPGAEGDPASPAGVLAALLPPGTPGDRAELRRAGAALLAYADRGGRTLPVLAEALARAGAAGERRALRFALLRAQRASGRLEEMLATANAALAEEPASRAAFSAAAFALQELRRPAELEQAAAAVLALVPGDPEVLSDLGGARIALGDLAGAARAFGALVEGGTATPLVYNNAAWLELFVGEPGPRTLDWARRAVDQDRARSSASLNTLAVVLATLGRPGEAREIFVSSLEARPPGPADWYAFGLVAEAWGLPDAARTAYGRVTEERVDGRPDPSGAHVLAARRLAALAGTPARGAGGGDPGTR